MRSATVIIERSIALFADPQLHQDSALQRRAILQPLNLASNAGLTVYRISVQVRLRFSRLRSLARKVDVPPAASQSFSGRLVGSLCG